MPQSEARPPETQAVKRIFAQGLRVERGGRAILRDLDFDLRAGEALLVLGRNGAGKSTLLRALAGLLPLRGGEIRLEGGASETPLAEQAHYVGHADGLKAALTALENLQFWSHMLKASSGSALSPEGALAKVGLARVGDFPVAYLSAGQKRRVALARLFVAPRPVWLLDEPATALDVGSQEKFAEAMAAHRAGGGFVIAATHAPLGLIGGRELRLDAATPRNGAGEAA
ncbi:heme ABC exporter ATP-binding protein CcmA [Rhodoblastus acidophilus]|uniref:Heme ABC exporter ATP-binding protein CcmA n=1 Tax=Candidatus Rhodoblastus alkanivorans TaxID=2954117 RepID=A0ABS9Z3E6_9HYPH|nr:heme ABC exporter ATP-binding protein CcmA [Candidatus Rhodoblastus alkanivorans]MCI4681586.1 heme ABC exporter ATP-binding protein CcmA [Candidatus Rhodoblastus alkanivorans]MDI4642634.1 heme ABC exporter ATP-binding protein CcmA [Rhodoblastus acidophilus]